MRILHLITPAHVSGAELMLIAAARRQQAMGHSVRIACKPLPAFVDRARASGIETTPISLGGKLNPRAFGAVSTAIRQYEPDVVCAHLSTAAFWGALAARRMRVPMAAVVHGFNSALWYRPAPALICVSASVRTHMEAQRIPPSRTIVVYNGIDPRPYFTGAVADLPAPAGTPTVGIVAHLSPKKGFAELLEAAEEVVDAHFVVVGTGAMREQLEQASAQRLNGRLHMLGWRDDVPAIMRAVDVFCLPSRREPFGLVLLEAMAAAKPTVAFASGGAPEVIDDGVTGLLAQPGSPASLAAALRRLLSDPSLRAAMGAAGRSRVLSHFTDDISVTSLNDALAQIRNAQKGP